MAVEEDEPAALVIRWSEDAERCVATAVDAKQLKSLKLEAECIVQRWVKPRGGISHDHHIRVLWHSKNPLTVLFIYSVSDLGGSRRGAVVRTKRRGPDARDGALAPGRAPPSLQHASFL